MRKRRDPAFHLHSLWRSIDWRKRYFATCTVQHFNHLKVGLEFSDSLISALISCLRSSTSISCTRSVHCRVIKSVGYSLGFLGDQLVSSYLNLDLWHDARYLFEELPSKDLVSWNSFISAFSRRRELDVCFHYFSRMKLECCFIPNEVTLISMISSCSNPDTIDIGKFFHAFSAKLGYVPHESKVCNAFVSFYGKAGDLAAADRLFGEMKWRNSVSWNSIISVHIQTDLNCEGIDLFIEMRRRGMMPEQATLLTLLRACERVGLRTLAYCFHGYIIRYGFLSNWTVSTALLTLYSKLGLLSSTCQVFNEMTFPDTVAWTAKLAAFAVHGLGPEAVETFELMVRKGAVPDHVTFTHLLSACSHSGLVKEGKHYFNVMSNIYGIEPRIDHFSCMVDLLGRSGMLVDAYNLIRGMPMTPNSGIWGALLAACRDHGNIDLGKEAAERLITLDPSDIRNYLMLSNMYAASGRWQKASEIRSLIRNKNLKRYPGRSFIEHGNKLHIFAVDEQLHPDIHLINNMLEVISGKIRKAGYESRTEFVLHYVDEDLKNNLINRHSEKLAIAFGLLATSAGTPLIITKNLKICGDCHNFAKFVSLTEKRTLVIRDVKRFHHFSNGLCSCGDFW